MWAPGPARRDRRETVADGAYARTDCFYASARVTPAVCVPRGPRLPARPDQAAACPEGERSLAASRGSPPRLTLTR
ncbi:hypothetical protein FAIPA1_50005 [Frankia sp. AiPs1]